ncbi:MAG: hypothetical protein ACEQR8_02700 [Cypionkella sp.]
MKRSHPIALAALAALLPTQLQAQVAKPCITEREVAQMTIYAVPALVEGVRGKCGPKLSKSGFLATRGSDFAARYAALKDETWPAAKAGVLKIVGGQNARDKATIATFASLPDDSVRPLVDAMIAQQIGASIKPEQCGQVERGLQLASVMNPRDSGALIAFVMAMAKPKNPAICPTPPQ